MQLISRGGWGARKPTRSTPMAELLGWTAHWEGSPLGIAAHSQCGPKVRGIQADHMDGRNSDHKPWLDIAYSFLYCPHGYVFEGRGWDVRPAANGNADANAHWLAFCYLGGQGDPFTPAAQQALQQLSTEAARRGALQHQPHSHFFATQCPGDQIRQYISRDFHAASQLSTQPAPPPATTITDTRYSDVDIISREFANVVLDESGNGWVGLTETKDRMISITQLGGFPPRDGYWKLCKFGAQGRALPDGTQTVIQISEGSSRQQISFTVLIRA